ncbi:hypothetical protein [Leptospira barantonii]|uniref:DUF5673 domain-containing protein n=1 Tax=Leptospira barantonii TaxID=2023184 RepID=A0ABX4NRF4_9LEPT|nr:hypothetical protein [Leptospira barantonii]PJZ59295.1 hypothetical protein CH367_04580 [Leptospira barantonii]
MKEYIVPTTIGSLFSILLFVVSKYWVQKLFVSDTTNDAEAKKNTFQLPKSFVITGYITSILFFLIFIGSYFLIPPAENGNINFLLSFWLLLCFFGIWILLYSKFYSVSVDSSGMTENGFFTKEKRIFWHDIKSVRFNSYSGNLIFADHSSFEIKVSVGIKNLNVFLEILKVHLREHLYTKALEDFSKYQKNLRS